MKIEVISYENTKVVFLEGDLNSTTALEAETRIQQIVMGGNKKIIINLEKLNYISSAGLRIFLSINKLTKKSNGEMRVCCLNPTVKEVFDISGFRLIFKIYDTEQAAREDF